MYLLGEFQGSLYVVRCVVRRCSHNPDSLDFLDFVNRHAAHHYNEARASQYNHNQFLVPLAKQYRGIIYKNGKLWRSLRLPFSPLPAVPDLKSGAALVIYLINGIIDDQVRWDDSGFFVDY
jgi:hypothetical protein